MKIGTTVIANRGAVRSWLYLLLQMNSIFYFDIGNVTVTRGSTLLPEVAQMQTWSGLIPMVAVGLLLILLIAGFLIWRLMFSGDQTDFSQRFEQNKFSPDDANPVAGKELNPKSVSKSAETVSNKTDDDVVELRDRFSTRPTVDAMSDLSVSTEEDDED